MMSDVQLKRITMIFYLSLFLVYFPLIIGFRANTGAYALGVFGVIFCLLRFSLQKEFRPVINLKGKSIFFFLWLYSSIAWIVIIAVKYFSLEFAIWDTGAFAQAISNLAFYGEYYNSLLGTHELAGHVDPALMAFSPLFSIWNSFLWLIFAKYIAFIASPWIIVKISKKILGDNSRLVYIAPILFLFNPYIIKTQLFQFQPSSLVIPFILMAFYYAMEEKNIRVFLLLCLIVSFKENLALVWVSVGFYYIVMKKQFSYGSLLTILGIVLGLVLHFYIKPSFHPDLINMHQGHFGPFELIPEKFELLLITFLSVGFLPCFSPKTLLFILPAFGLVTSAKPNAGKIKTLLFILPAFGLALVTKHPSLVTTSFHYQDVPLAILIIGSIYGLTSIRSISENKSSLLNYSGLGVALLIFFIHTTTPSQYIKSKWPEKSEIDLLSEVKSLYPEIPSDYTVWATEPLGVHLIGHPKLRALDRWSGKSKVKREVSNFIVVLSKKAKYSDLGQENYYYNIVEHFSGLNNMCKLEAINGEKFNELLVYYSKTKTGCTIF